MGGFAIFVLLRMSDYRGVLIISFVVLRSMATALDYYFHFLQEEREP